MFRKVTWQKLRDILQHIELRDGCAHVRTTRGYWERVFVEFHRFYEASLFWTALFTSAWDLGKD